MYLSVSERSREILKIQSLPLNILKHSFWPKYCLIGTGYNYDRTLSNLFYFDFVLKLFLSFETNLNKINRMKILIRISGILLLSELLDIAVPILCYANSQSYKC